MLLINSIIQRVGPFFPTTSPYESYLATPLALADASGMEYLLDGRSHLGLRIRVAAAAACAAAARPGLPAASALTALVAAGELWWRRSCA